MENTKAQQKFISSLDKELQNDPDINMKGFGIKQMLEDEKERIINDMYMPECEVDNQIENLILDY